MRCMVLAQIKSASAPARSSRRAASSSTVVARSHSPAACMAATGAKSTDHRISRAECMPPSLDRTPRFSSW